MHASLQSDKQIFVVAGESSADRLAASVIRTLCQQSRLSPHQVFGVGGPMLRHIGCDILVPAERFNVMGFTEVLPALPRIFRAIHTLRQATQRSPPPLALLVDMPALNTRLGPRLARHGTRVIYLGAPQAWAWRPHRASAMASWVDTLACLFPFEPAFFNTHGVHATFVGHPRAQDARTYPRDAPRSHVVLMPGSRPQELCAHAPMLRGVIAKLHAYDPTRQMIIPVAPMTAVDELRSKLGELSRHVSFWRGDALAALSGARAAVIASGTAVTEAVLMHTPMVVVYKVAPLTHLLARHLIRVPNIAMANVLAGERVVEECLQQACHEDIVWGSLRRLIDDDRAFSKQQQQLVDLSRLLEGPTGGASAAVAALLRAALRV